MYFGRFFPLTFLTVAVSAAGKARTDPQRRRLLTACLNETDVLFENNPFLDDTLGPQLPEN